MAAYTIVKSDGNVLCVIPEGQINTANSSLALPGKNYSAYGLPVDTDLVHLAENFADSTPPPAAIRGQIWFDTGNATMKYTPINYPPTVNDWVSFAVISNSANVTFGNVVATGTISGNNLNASNNITAGGNITAVGNVSAANFNTAGNASIGGNLTAGNANLGNLATANWFNGGNFSGSFLWPGGAGTDTQVIFNDGGTLSSNAGLTFNKTTQTLTASNLTVSGNLTYINTETLTVEDPIINLGGGPNGAAPITSDGKDRGSQLQYYNTTGSVAANAFMGWDSSAAEFIFISNVVWSTPGEVVNVGASTLGNLRLGNINATSVTLPSGSPVTITDLTTGAPTTQGNITGNWVLTPGSRMQATYADLAERHAADAKYAEGTVVKIGGEKEVTQTTSKNDVTEVLGVVSTSYAYLMNADAGSDETHPAVAYVGRVPVRVVGAINKGDKVTTSSTPGCATVSMSGQGFGWAIESNDSQDEKLVLCIIR